MPSLPPKFVPPIRTLPGARYGTVITLFSANPFYEFEIQRATDASGTGATTIATNVPNSQKVFVDSFGNNGTTYYWRIRHTLPLETPSPWTCWKGGTPSLIANDPAPAKAVYPIIQVTQTRDNTSGYLTVTIDDPQCRVVLVEFETINNGVSSGWVTDSSVPYSASVALHPTATNQIRYRVTGYDEENVLRILGQDSFDYRIATNVRIVLPVGTDLWA